MQQQLSYWLVLSQARGFSPRRIKQLYEAFGSLERLFCASSAELQQAGLGPALQRRLRQLAPLANRPCPLTEAWLGDSQQHHLLSLDDPRYPAQLRQIDDPPPLLFVDGDPELLALPQVAIIGSRKASRQGLSDAVAFARGLSAAGLIPTSGLALGIDACAHQGALLERGLTVAVLGSGIDQVYPVRNRPLAAEVLARGGVLVSEFPLGTPPLPAYFPRRNRIISGLSMVVLVVEAALRSGSLITARLAAEQGRDVCALPGSIHDPARRGCHQLIRQGALLVESVEQVLEELAPQLPRIDRPMVETSPAPDPATEEGARVLEATGYEPTSLDLLVERCGLAAEVVQAELLGLELEGLVTAVSGGYQRC